MIFHFPSKLRGKTVFITGASRGIGRAIAVKAARDGANVVVAAKTTEPHPRLPGTIHTVAEEVLAAGGRALACCVDVRSETQVRRAVHQAVDVFGGIDVLVNNATVVHMTQTRDTKLKTFDLMSQVNARGTFLCSQACLPHLLKSDNPHIINISPPLNMKPKWFQGHVAYTMAKYGMSMCVLGMSEEFRDDGVAVNALWPRTAVWTSAMARLGGGEIQRECRDVSVMSDAAYVMMTRDSRTYTGNFAIDDEVLMSVGVTDISRYDCVPGNKLIPDYFLDPVPDSCELNSVTSPLSRDTSLDNLLTTVGSLLSRELVNSVQASYTFEMTDSPAMSCYLDLKSGTGAVGLGPLPGSDVIMCVDSKMLAALLTGTTSVSAAFMSGQVKLKQGHLPDVIKLEVIAKRLSAKL